MIFVSIIKVNSLVGQVLVSLHCSLFDTEVKVDITASNAINHTWALSSEHRLESSGIYCTDGGWMAATWYYIWMVISLGFPIRVSSHSCILPSHHSCSLMDERKSVWYSIMLNFQTNISGDFRSVQSSFYNPILKRGREIKHLNFWPSLNVWLGGN